MAAKDSPKLARAGKAKAEGADRPIIMAVDGSDESRQALQYFVENLYRPEDRIIVMTCQEYPPNLAQRSQHLMSEGMIMNAEVWGNIVSREKERVDKVTEEFVDTMKQLKIKGDFRRVQGKPGETIINEAKEENAKLIIVGARGIGRLRKTLLGSVSDYVIQHAPCPVTVYRIDLRVK